ncbi:MAG: chemotaxis protein CheW, partial [Spirochaetota bacterium]
MQRLEPADPAALKALKERTKALARPPESSLLEEGAERLLVFKAGGRSFAFPSDQVRRVAAAPRVFPLPGLPPHIPGVANILGEILPVADL